MRLLPVTIGAMAALAVAKADALWRGAAPAARAQETPPPAAPSQTRPQAPAPAPPVARPAPAAATPDPEALAERGVLEALRQRRGEIEAREAQLSLRETVLAAAERRIAQRLDELTALQRRLEALEAARGEREEAAWRRLVRTYETMRPRDAATIFDEMEMPVLVQILDRMGERRAAPVIGAMRPDRARLVTAELARHRTRAPAQ